jgi:hypothetical protein
MAMDYWHICVLCFEPSDHQDFQPTIPHTHTDIDGEREKETIIDRCEVSLMRGGGRSGRER